METLESLNLVLSVVTKSLLLIVMIVLVVMSFLIFRSVQKILKRVDETSNLVKDKVEDLKNVSFEPEEIFETVSRKSQAWIYKLIIKLLKRFFNF